MGVEDLSVEVSEIFEELLQEQLVELETLLKRLSRHMESLRQSVAQAELVDEELAETIGARAQELLERVLADYEEEDHRYVQACVRYFIMRHDDEDDLESPAGFDDDLEVFNAVASYLGHDDLVIGY